MITWILGTILIIWCIVRRASKDGKVEGYPLGMPRGTVRAVITLMIVSFPFHYLIYNKTIPSIITNALFILIAFYFEARKGSEYQLKLIREIKNPEKVREEKKKEKHPLYLPKYTVRSSLIIILVLVIVINIYGPDVPFEAATNTLFDILIIVILYFIGNFFRAVGLSRQKKKLKKQVRLIPNYQELSKYELLERVNEEKPSWWRTKGRSILSLLTLTAVVIALISFTFGWEYSILDLPFYTISIQDLLLLAINVYYGFRD